jgi:hypothetical protein
VFVDPVTGLLRRTPERPRAVPVPVRDRLVLRDDSQLQRIRGVWYHVVLRPVPPTFEERRTAEDAVLGVNMLNYWQWRDQLRAQHGQTDVYAASKRQVGKRALARLLPEDLR